MFVSKKSKNFNQLIEADSHYSLAALKTHSFEKQIHFIYIDPPHNTAGGNWKCTNGWISIGMTLTYAQNGYLL